MLTWSQLGIHDKPVALLDVAGFWDPLFALLARAVDEGFVRPEHGALAMRSDDPAAALDAMEAWRPPTVAKWLDLDRS